MVLIDGVKFACDGCIKGHRSSKCTHTTRPLREIKKKGRPQSQCSHCRELRRTRSVHGRCECEGRDEEVKPKSIALLPNGLSDVYASTSTLAIDPSLAGLPPEYPKPSRVSQLLNPCNCRSTGRCNCCHVVSRASPSGSSNSSLSSRTFSTTSQLTADSPSSSTTSLVSTSKPSCCAAPPAREPLVASTASCCSSITGDPLSPSFGSNLPPPPQKKACCSPAAPPPPPPNPFAIPPLPSEPQSALFLPSTHGTKLCFCGPSCSCVGCELHDPLGLKSGPSTVLGGDGCGCSTSGISVEGGSACCDRPSRGLEVLGFGIAAVEGGVGEGLPSFETLWKFINGADAGGAVEADASFAGVDVLPEREEGGELGATLLDGDQGWRGGRIENFGCARMYALSGDSEARDAEAEAEDCGEECVCGAECGCRSTVLQAED